jgi:hypothetical protein
MISPNNCPKEKFYPYLFYSNEFQKEKKNPKQLSFEARSAYMKKKK